MMEEVTFEEIRDLYLEARRIAGERTVKAVVRGFTDGTGLLIHVQRSDYPKLAAVLRYLNE